MDDRVAARHRKIQTPHEDALEVYSVDHSLPSIENIPGIAERGRDAAKDQHCLFEYHEIPGYLKDNEYILSYYRVDLSLKESVRSLLMMHNETLNIWTHLVGFFIFLCFTILAFLELPMGSSPSALSMCLQGMGQESNRSKHCLLEAVKKDITRMMSPVLWPATRWPVFVFLGGSMFCLLASSICHLFTCHSKNVAIFLMRMDYAGIAVMIATSFFPPIYYVFQCTPIWQIIYLTTITLMAIASIAALFEPVSQSGKYRAYRAVLFLAMGFSGVIPAVHAIAMHWHEPFCVITVTHEALMAFFYAIGTLFYVTRVPEKWRPGLFDLGGHSHNIFHIFVIAGAYTHYRAVRILLEWRDLTSCK